MVLLGVLVITFSIGVRSTRPGLYTEKFGTSPRRFMTPIEVSVPAQINGRSAHTVMSKSYTTLDEPRVQHRVLGQRGLISTGNLLPTLAGLTFNIRRNWSLRSRREPGVAEASFTRAGSSERSIGTSTRSIRGISEAAPGNKTDSGQVPSSSSLAEVGLGRSRAPLHILEC